MGKHTISNQKWAYSAEQMAAALQNPEGLRYKQGMLDALRAVSRLEDNEIEAPTLQSVLDSLPHTWDTHIHDAYVVGFEDMYGLLAESLSTHYAPAPVTLEESVQHQPTPRSPEIRLFQNAGWDGRGWLGLGS